MRRIVVLVCAVGCGRLGFAPTDDATGPRDADRDGSAPGGDTGVPIDAPSRFGRFVGASGGRALALASPQGDLYVGGYLEQGIDLGGGTLPYSGADDVFLARYTAGGEHVWSRSFGSTGNEVLNDVTADAAGDAYLTGLFTTSIDFGGGAIASAADTDIYVASFTAAGQYRWARRIGSIAVGVLDSGHSIAAGPGGALYVTGVTQGTADAGGTPFTCAAASQAMFLAALTTDGAHRWSRCYGNGDFNSARGAAVDAQGNLYITGYFSGSLNLGGGNLSTFGSLDVFVASFTSTGTYRWARSFGSGGDDWGNKLAVDAAGNVTATGFFGGSINPGGGSLTSAGQIDAFVVSYTTTGAFRWAHSYGSAGCDAGRRVFIEPGGDVRVAGTFAGTSDFGGGPIVASGPLDGFALHLTSTGAYVDASSLGGAMSDDTQGIVASPAGVVVTGRYDSVASGCANASDINGEAYLLKL